MMRGKFSSPTQIEPLNDGQRSGEGGLAGETLLVMHRELFRRRRDTARSDLDAVSQKYG